MQREIIWSPNAEIAYLQTLRFWCDNNKSTKYAEKLKKQVTEVQHLISHYPLTGTVVY